MGILKLAGNLVTLQDSVEGLLNGLRTGAQVLGYIVNENTDRSYMAHQHRIYFEFVDRGAKKLKMKLIALYDKNEEQIVDIKVHLCNENGNMELQTTKGTIEEKIMMALEKL